jgi:hypothetical protein
MNVHDLNGGAYRGRSANGRRNHFDIGILKPRQASAGLRRRRAVVEESGDGRDKLGRCERLRQHDAFRNAL